MRRISTVLSLALLAAPSAAAAAGLEAVASFGTNPGALQMFKYVPADMPANAPLIVLLHGCTQNAAQFANAGFNQIADDRKVYLVYAQQSSANNPVSCFNWAGEYGDPANLVRGQGENQSIKEMVDRMKADHGIDSARIYVAGFSAGAAFVPVLLATWPDVFAGGAVMSGVPYRCAQSVQGAYDCMAIGSHPELKHTAGEWGDLVRAASPGFSGPRPPVILFHGTTDFTVHTDNLGELIEQWTDVLGADATPATTEMVGAHQRTTYQRDGVPVVEAWRIAGMGHAVPIAPRAAEHPCGATGAFVEDRGVCAAYEAARFFGLYGSGGGAAGQGGSGTAGTGGGTAGAGGGTAGAGGGSAGAGGGSAGAGSGAAGITVRITSPADGSMVSGPVEVRAEATAAGGVQRVAFEVDGMARSGDTSAPYAYRWQSSLAGAGAHTITVTAFDALGQSASAEVTVTVGEGGVAGAGAGQGGGPTVGGAGSAADDDRERKRVDPIACAGAPGAPAGLSWLLVLLAGGACLRLARRG